jgi:hypothetical protein
MRAAYTADEEMARHGVYTATMLACVHCQLCSSAYGLLHAPVKLQLVCTQLELLSRCKCLVEFFLRCTYHTFKGAAACVLDDLCPIALSGKLLQRADVQAAGVTAV